MKGARTNEASLARFPQLDVGCLGGRRKLYRAVFVSAVKAVVVGGFGHLGNGKFCN